MLQSIRRKNVNTAAACTRRSLVPRIDIMHAFAASSSIVAKGRALQKEACRS